MLRGKTLFLATVLIWGGASSAFADDADWSGVWVTDEGAMTLTQDGTTVQGSYGRGAQLEAEASGNSLDGTYRVGNVSGDVSFEMQSGGRHFTGKWIRGTNSGTWRGWKQDKDAKSGDTADFSGHWLTSLGTIVLAQDGALVEGPWRHAGWDRVEGEVSGRRLEATLIRPTWQGSVWLELTPDGKRIFGLTDETPPSAVRGVRVDDFEHDPRLKAGELAKGVADNGMLYFARPPKKWSKGKAVDAIVLLHGSNWTTQGMAWVTARNWPDLGEDYMIVGIQGDNWSTWSDPDDLRFNYHYVNWMGRSTYKGYPYTERDSPYLVSKLVAELAKKHKWKRIFIGGHSQGGFLAYLMYMHYPEQFAGVFPVAGGLVMQAEPDVFKDEALQAAQRATPLAIVHGKNDNVVPHATGLYIRDRFEGAGFPLMHFFAPDLGHPYDFLPIGDAIHWLDAMSTTDKKVLVSFARDAAASGRWRDVAGALIRAQDLGCERRLKDAASQFDQAAAKEAKRFLDLLEKGEGGAWVDPFIDWKRQFERAPSALETMAAYERLRDEHDPVAKALIAEARDAFRAGDRALGRAKYEAVLETAFAARKYPIVKRWVADLD